MGNTPRQARWSAPGCSAAAIWCASIRQGKTNAMNRIGSSVVILSRARAHARTRAHSRVCELHSCVRAACACTCTTAACETRPAPAVCGHGARLREVGGEDGVDDPVAQLPELRLRRESRSALFDQTLKAVGAAVRQWHSRRQRPERQRSRRGSLSAMLGSGGEEFTKSERTVERSLREGRQPFVARSDERA
eukprot:6211866-Pleurochrysis_carterae.AAC.6